MEALQLLNQAPSENEVREVLEKMNVEDRKSTPSFRVRSCTARPGISFATKLIYLLFLDKITLETFIELFKEIYLPPDEHHKRLFGAFEVCFLSLYFKISSEGARKTLHTSANAS